MNNLKLIQLTILLVTLSSFLKVEGIKISRKLDDTNPDLGNKCGGCPCNNPCNPPPSPPPPSPPLPKPKPTPTPGTNCPPPPRGGGQYPTPGGSGPYQPNTPYIYVNGPPGNLYPIDHYYSGSGRIVVGFYPFLIASGVMLLAFG